MAWTWLLGIGICGFTSFGLVSSGLFYAETLVARYKAGEEDESPPMHNYRTWAPYLNLPAEWIPGTSAFEVRSYYARKHQINISDVIALRYIGDGWRSRLK